MKRAIMFVCCVVFAVAVAACATTSTSASIDSMCENDFHTLAEHAKHTQEDGLSLMKKISVKMIARDRIQLKNNIIMWEQVVTWWLYLADDKVAKKDKREMATDVSGICWNAAYRIRELAGLYKFTDNDLAIIERLASGWEKESRWWAWMHGSPCLH